jgi:hypothetical protein
MHFTLNPIPKMHQTALLEARFTVLEEELNSKEAHLTLPTNTKQKITTIMLSLRAELKYHQSRKD